jgi:hypothetical protein
MAIWPAKDANEVRLLIVVIEIREITDQKVVTFEKNYSCLPFSIETTHGPHD